MISIVGTILSAATSPIGKKVVGAVGDVVGDAIGSLLGGDKDDNSQKKKIITEAQIKAKRLSLISLQEEEVQSGMKKTWIGIAAMVFAIVMFAFWNTFTIIVGCLAATYGVYAIINGLSKRSAANREIEKINNMDDDTFIIYSGLDNE